MGVARLQGVKHNFKLLFNINSCFNSKIIKSKTEVLYWRKFSLKLTCDWNRCNGTKIREINVDWWFSFYRISFKSHKLKRKIFSISFCQSTTSHFFITIIKHIPKLLKMIIVTDINLFAKSYKKLRNFVPLTEKSNDDL